MYWEEASHFAKITFSSRPAKLNQSFRLYNKSEDNVISQTSEKLKSFTQIQHESGDNIFRIYSP